MAANTKDTTYIGCKWWIDDSWNLLCVVRTSDGAKKERHLGAISLIRSTSQAKYDKKSKQNAYNIEVDDDSVYTLNPNHFFPMEPKHSSNPVNKEVHGLIVASHSFTKTASKFCLFFSFLILQY